MFLNRLTGRQDDSDESSCRCPSTDDCNGSCRSCCARFALWRGCRKVGIKQGELGMITIIGAARSSVRNRGGSFKGVLGQLGRMLSKGSKNKVDDDSAEASAPAASTSKTRSGR